MIHKMALEDSTRFQKILEGSRRSNKVQKESRRFKKFQGGSRRFKRIQEGPRRFKRLKGGSSMLKKVQVCYRRIKKAKEDSIRFTYKGCQTAPKCSRMFQKVLEGQGSSVFLLLMIIVYVGQILGAAHTLQGSMRVLDPSNGDYKQFRCFGIYYPFQISCRSESSKLKFGRISSRRSQKDLEDSKWF